MKGSTIWQTIKKHSIWVCMLMSVIFIIIAAQYYPGGSLIDKNSVGFDWSKNFLSNLFETKAINGLENPGRVWALIGMAFYSIGNGFFFINMSKKIPSRQWATILKLIGVVNVVLIFLIATPMHDVGVISIVLTLLGLFTITIWVLKSQLHLLKFCCIIALLTYYFFFFLFGFGYLGWAVIMQKVYNISSMLLVVALSFFTKHEDFMLVKSKVQKT